MSRHQLTIITVMNRSVPAGVSVDRYARQSRFWGIGRQGQERLLAARVVVIGCGALGCATVDLLARSGVGSITAVDRDVVEVSNLHRQVLFDESDARDGTPKAVAAAEAAARFNSEVTVTPVVADVTSDNIEALVGDAQVVLDGTDNLETRYLLNDVCVKLGIPWIYGGAVGSTGVAMTVIPGETSCFRCTFPTPPPAGSLDTCETAGVLPSTVVTVSAFQWTEAVKLLIGDREHLNRSLVYFDLWDNEHLETDRPAPVGLCPCCQQHRFEFLEASVAQRTASLCGRNAVQVSPSRSAPLDLADLARRLQGVGTVSTTRFLLRLEVGEHELTVFPDGRAIVKGTDDLGLARTLYARYVGA